MPNMPIGDLWSWAPPKARGSQARQACAIMVEPGQAEPLDWDNYLLLLTGRIHWLLRQEADPVEAVQRLEREMEEADLWHGLLPEGNQREAINNLVFGNMQLRNRLSQLMSGLLPLQIKADDPEARRLLVATDLWEWLGSLVRLG